MLHVQKEEEKEDSVYEKTSPSHQQKGFENNPLNQENWVIYIRETQETFVLFKKKYRKKSLSKPGPFQV
jgi:hypothetical protein